MDKEKMTICQCCEFLDTMIGDNQEIKECIDYIQERAEAMSRKLMEYKEKQTPKKPYMMRIKKYDGYNIGICECGAVLDTSMNDDVNYCHKCGQKIDWSGEDE